ncbi:hypothetical protein NDI56_09855 [Haloarcula sp. S1CR25-12]|uniref:Uncharacterized protein n=1 Tax=Haloarcula saliterrae TaxID=2950534 RepID=A0ABU2FBQ5_9EURY|nr:hypothetical protein [Haloarcula sp. S1CR25-12]MDS0259695.1 hypothetical protein [Haloarcula sp. S1CR25-12]
MTTAHERRTDRLTNWSHRTALALLTATLLVGSLSTVAMSLGDPELLALLAAVGCGLALLGIGLTAMTQRRIAASNRRASPDAA